MALQHQDLGFENSLVGQRKVDSHLVAIEVGIESRTGKRMELNGLTLNHLRLEGLNTETVKCRSTVEENRVTFHHMLQNIPNDRILTIDNLLGRLHGLDDAALDELANDERLVQLGCHKLRQTAFTHIQLRTYDDN